MGTIIPYNVSGSDPYLFSNRHWATFRPHYSNFWRNCRFISEKIQHSCKETPPNGRMEWYIVFRHQETKTYGIIWGTDRILAGKSQYSKSLSQLRTDGLRSSMKAERTRSAHYNFSYGLISRRDFVERYPGTNATGFQSLMAIRDHHVPIRQIVVAENASQIGKYQGTAQLTDRIVYTHQSSRSRSPHSRTWNTSSTSRLWSVSHESWHKKCFVSTNSAAELTNISKRITSPPNVDLMTVKTPTAPSIQWRTPKIKA